MSITEIEFQILSDDELVIQSACQITKTKDRNGPNSIYDERMGPHREKEICVTCNKGWRLCPGHFGFIDLNVSILHPMFQKYAEIILRSFCHYCFSCYLNVEIYSITSDHEINYINAIEYISKIKYCRECKRDVPKIMLKENIFEVNKKTLPIEHIQKIFSSIDREELKYIGLENLNPNSFIVSKFPVIPTRSRPPTMDKMGISKDDTITNNLIEILKTADLIKGAKDLIKHISKLYFLISTHIDNNAGKNNRNNSIVLKGFKERISGKTGLIRENILGKRTNQSARTVAGPDVNLETDQILIPMHFAQKLTYTEYVTEYNIDTLQDFVDQGRVNYVQRGNNKYNLKYALFSRGTRLECGDTLLRNGNEIDYDSHTVIQDGDVIVREGTHIRPIVPRRKKFSLHISDKVFRWLKNDDIILLNRQPTLHKGSFYFVRVKLLECRCKEGKECSVCSIKTIRVPLSLCSSLNLDFDGDELNLNVPANPKSAAEIKLLGTLHNNFHSSQTGGPILSLTQDAILGSYTMTKNNVDVSRDEFFDIITIILDRIQIPTALTTHTLFSVLFPTSLFFSNSEVVIENGQIVSGFLTKQSLKTIPAIISREYGAQAGMDFVSGVQFLVKGWLKYHPQSVGVQDCLIPDTLKDEIDAILNTECRYKEEGNQRQYLGNIKNSCMRVVQDTFKTNNFAPMIESGAKGSLYNVTQIASLLGQQIFKGNRITEPLVHYKSSNTQRELFASQGFVEHSFAFGLSPQEFFYHCMSGREAVVDTAVKTPDSGYIYRRMVRLMENIHIAYDGTVRDGDKVLSFTYGQDNIDCAKEVNNSFCDVYSIVNKLNNE